MTYKKKITVLSGIIASLAIIYILSVVFDYERTGSRSALYFWLDPGQKNNIEGITISNVEETIALVRKGDEWFISRNGRDYPARRVRVEDFIGTLIRRAPYPVLSSSVSSHERLSLTEDRSIQITVTGKGGQSLLNLLIGIGDITGQNVHMRKQGQNEVRSGEDIFSTYVRSTLASWYNLRLFPESEEGRLDATGVQRLTVYPPPTDDGENVPPRIFTRSGREWTFSGFELNNPGMGRVDGYIRDILGTSGDNFIEDIEPSDPMFNNSRIVLELGNGTIRTIRLGPSDESGRRLAVISGSNWVYSLPVWASMRLFADAETFERDY